MIDKLKDTIRDGFKSYLEANDKFQIYYGSPETGKTYFLVQRMIYDLLKGNRSYLVLSKYNGRYIDSYINHIIESVIRNAGLEDGFELLPNLVRSANNQKAIISKVTSNYAFIQNSSHYPCVQSASELYENGITDILIDGIYNFDLAEILHWIYQPNRNAKNKRITVSFNYIEYKNADKENKKINLLASPDALIVNDNSIGKDTTKYMLLPDVRKIVEYDSFFIDDEE